MIKRPDNIIAIDPDVSKNAVATLETATKALCLSSLTLVELIDYLKFIKKKCEELNQSLTVVVEVSWNNSHNTHIGKRDNQRTASKSGYNVGRNHQRGMDICEMAKGLVINVIKQPPLRKCWKGRNGKITHDELAYFTSITGRTNQEERDACLICWNYANFPIKIKYK